MYMYIYIYMCSGCKISLNSIAATSRCSPREVRSYAGTGTYLQATLEERRARILRDPTGEVRSYAGIGAYLREMGGFTRPRAQRLERSSEFGTHKTVKARFRHI